MSDHSPQDIPPLHEVLRFTEKDIEANRTGMMSKAQKNRLYADMERRIITGTVITLLLAGAGFWTLSLGSWVWPVVLWAMAAAFYLLNRMGRGPLVNEVRAGQVAAVHGEATLYANDIPNPNGKVMEYVLTIGEESFVLGHSAFIAFEDGESYAVYFLPTARKVLSAEKL